jgi:hypothetical protein
MIRLTDFDLGWIVGIFEGEGTVFVSNGSPTVAVEMTDLDTLANFYRILQVGSIKGPYTRNNNRPTWTWVLRNRTDCTILIQMLYPHLSDRRKLQCDRLLEWDKNTPRRYKAGYKSQFYKKFPGNYNEMAIS